MLYLMSDEGLQLYQRRQLLDFKLNGIIFSDYFESPDINEHRFSGLTSVGNSRNHNFGAFLCIQTYCVRHENKKVQNRNDIPHFSLKIQAGDSR